MPANTDSHIGISHPRTLSGKENRALHKWTAPMTLNRLEDSVENDLLVMLVQFEVDVICAAQEDT